VEEIRTAGRLGNFDYIFGIDVTTLNEGSMIVGITYGKGYKREHHAHENNRHRAAQVRLHQSLHKHTIRFHVEANAKIYEGFENALRKHEHQKDDGINSSDTQEQKSFPGFAIG